MENIEISMHKNSFDQTKVVPYTWDLHNEIKENIKNKYTSIKNNLKNSITHDQKQSRIKEMSRLEDITEILNNSTITASDHKEGTTCFILQDKKNKSYRHGITNWEYIYMSNIGEIDGIQAELNNIKIISQEWDTIRYWISSPREINIKSYDTTNKKKTNLDLIKIRNYQLKCTKTQWKLQVELIWSFKWLKWSMNRENIVVNFVEDELKNNTREKTELMKIAKNEELHLPPNIWWSTLQPLLKNKYIKELIKNFTSTSH